MAITITSPSPIEQPTQVSAPLPADTASVDRFNSLMSPQSTAKPQATDAQIATIPKGDLDRLHAKWGNDDVGFREEAYGLWQIGENMGNDVVRNIITDAFKRMQERSHE
jgi:hypothetical protein